MGLYTIVTTRDDHWWQAQIRKIRDTRVMSDADRNAVLQVLIRFGAIQPADIDTYTWILGYGWTPTEVYGQINGRGVEVIDAMTRAADLTVSTLPFTPQWPNRRGDDNGIGNAWYEPTGDLSPVGSVDPTGTYEKFMGAAQPGTTATYYADPTSPGIKMWVAVKPAVSAPVSVPGQTGGLGPIPGGPVPLPSVPTGNLSSPDAGPVSALFGGK